MPINLAKYRKLIVAVVGLGLFLLRTETGIGEDFLNYLIAILTALGIYQVPNAAGQAGVEVNLPILGDEEK